MKYPSTPLSSSGRTKPKKTDNPYEKATSCLCSLVSEQNIGIWISRITSFHTRHTKSKFIDQVADWLKDQLKGFGYSDVYFHNYIKDGYSLKNVICHKQGRSSKSNKIMVICAHYDCRIEDIENAKDRCPGANDNASGMSSVLELARILYSIDLEHSIQFVFFSGEEQDQWGSKSYAKYINENSLNLYRVINLDMVGHPPPLNQKQVIIERDIGNAVLSNDKDSKVFAKIIEQMAMDYAGLQMLAGPIYSSDYMPFEELGYVVAGLFDGGNTHSSYHSKNDIPSNLNMGYIASVTKTVLATILYESRIQSM
jgi:Zn-dependent M28 family amino/carboxypeptidase